MVLAVAAKAVAAIDASIVVAWQDANEPHHNDAVALIKAFPHLVLHTVNLAEVLAGMPRSQWPGVWTRLQAIGFEIHFTSADEMAAAKQDTRLKMPEACVIAAARARRADVVLTFDDRLKAAARRFGFATN
ncbi:MAG: PIN domain-containing protein [Bifidobacteriaceae bacterium]|jgi:predicted nucleic acid-binding protein|nr:PIN domain-containing protein [Bifidobacteriaceae bacterium]